MKSLSCWYIGIISFHCIEHFYLSLSFVSPVLLIIFSLLLILSLLHCLSHGFNVEFFSLMINYFTQNNGGVFLIKYFKKQKTKTTVNAAWLKSHKPLTKSQDCCIDICNVCVCLKFLCVCGMFAIASFFHLWKKFFLLLSGEIKHW